MLSPRVHPSGGGDVTTEGTPIGQDVITEGTPIGRDVTTLGTPIGWGVITGSTSIGRGVITGRYIRHSFENNAPGRLPIVMDVITGSYNQWTVLNHRGTCIERNVIIGATCIGRNVITGDTTIGRGVINSGYSHGTGMLLGFCLIDP